MRFFKMSFWLRLQISHPKIFPECIRGPLQMLWRATFGPRAANCPPLSQGLANVHICRIFLSFPLNTFTWNLVGCYKTPRETCSAIFRCFVGQSKVNLPFQLSKNAPHQNKFIFAITLQCDGRNWHFFCKNFIYNVFGFCSTAFRTKTTKFLTT